MGCWVSIIPFAAFSLSCAAHWGNKDCRASITQAGGKCWCSWVGLCSCANVCDNVLWQMLHENIAVTESRRWWIFPRRLCYLPEIRYPGGPWGWLMSVTHWQLPGKDRDLGVLIQASSCSCRQDNQQGTSMSASWGIEPWFLPEIQQTPPPASV